MIKEYMSSFNYLSIAVMILFFTLFWYLVYQALKMGRHQSEVFSKLPIENDIEIPEKKNYGGNANG
jgi:hypothetical protein